MIKFNFKNKNVFVTAGSKGIGFEIAKNFSKSGANVIISSSNLNNLKKAKKKILQTNKNAKVVTIKYDQEKSGFPKYILKMIKKKSISTIDILINNSGGPPVKNIQSLKKSDWEKALNANLKSAIFTCEAFLPGMIKKKWGRIINLTSLTAKEPSINFALSNVTRAALASFSKTLALEVGKHGITVNTILTGGVITDRLSSLIKKSAIKNKLKYKDQLKIFSDLVPNKYLASTDEFIQLILFLSTSNSSYINGAAIPIDGGSSKSVF